MMTSTHHSTTRTSDQRPTTMSIWVTFSVPGVHCYPLAPDDVSYLRSPHRHLFKFRVEVEVFHDEREIEYHQFLRWCKSHYATEEDCSNKSCETLARELAQRVLAEYGTTSSGWPRRILVEVSEDGECGSVVCIGAER